jgi:hypothetical protein
MDGHKKCKVSHMPFSTIHLSISDPLHNLQYRSIPHHYYCIELNYITLHAYQLPSNQSIVQSSTHHSVQKNERKKKTARRTVASFLFDNPTYLPSYKRGGQRWLNEWPVAIFFPLQVWLLLLLSYALRRSE